jgi:hypothetical protein
MHCIHERQKRERWRIVDNIFGAQAQRLSSIVNQRFKKLVHNLGLPRLLRGQRSMEADGNLCQM